MDTPFELASAFLRATLMLVYTSAVEFRPCAAHLLVN
jgi:hypothetical protein